MAKLIISAIDWQCNEGQILDRIKKELGALLGDTKRRDVIVQLDLITWVFDKKENNGTKEAA